MELHYRYAIVSFCPDLTDPAARSVPVAILIIANAGDATIAVATGWYPLEDSDPISSVLLRDIPRFLRAHVDEVLSSQADADAESIICALQHSLRNSVHVSEVSSAMVEQVATTTPEELGGLVTSRAISLFFGAMRSAGVYLVDSKSAPGSTSVVPSVPPLSLWQLPKYAGSHSTAEALA